VTSCSVEVKAATPRRTRMPYHMISYHLHLLRRHSLTQQRRTIQQIE